MKFLCDVLFSTNFLIFFIFKSFQSIKIRKFQIKSFGSNLMLDCEKNSHFLNYEISQNCL